MEFEDRCPNAAGRPRCLKKTTTDIFATSARRWGVPDSDRNPSQPPNPTPTPAPAQPRYQSIDDLLAHTGVRRDELATLAEIGALNAFGFDRRTALWQIEKAVRPSGELFDDNNRQSSNPPSSDSQSSDSQSPNRPSSNPQSPIVNPSSAIVNRQSPIESPLPPMTPPERLMAVMRH